MFHVSKWGDISFRNPLKSKKINNFVQARPVWLGRAFLFEFPRVFPYLFHNILLTHNIIYITETYEGHARAQDPGIAIMRIHKKRYIF